MSLPSWAGTETVSEHPAVVAPVAFDSVRQELQALLKSGRLDTEQIRLIADTLRHTRTMAPEEQDRTGWFAARDAGDGRLVGLMALAIPDPENDDELPAGADAANTIIVSRVVSLRPGVGQTLMRQAATVAAAEHKHLVGWALPGRPARLVRELGMTVDQHGPLTRAVWTAAQANKFATANTIPSIGQSRP
jgi:hypothetical protein